MLGKVDQLSAVILYVLVRSLYERLGGVYSIAAVVDDFIDRVKHNPIPNANAAVDEAHHRVSAAAFKYYVTEMV
jgi:hemoglobin